MIRLMIVALLAVFVVGATSATAHDQYRVIGTITKVTTKTLEVKQTKDGKTLSMIMDDMTIVKRDTTTVKATELKAGQSVVVDGLGDSVDDLLVLEVRIVPAPAKK